jgi:3-hydroxyacyl-CoA dehydrogenase
VPVVLFDLPAKEGPKNGIVTEGGIEGLKKLKPAPLGVPEDAALIQPANYDEHLDLLGLRPGHRGHRRAHGLEAGPVQKVAPHIAPHAIVASNTSGLSITKLSEVLPEAHQAALLRHPLLQPAALHAAGGADPHPGHAKPQMLDQLEAFVTTTPGQGRGAGQGHAQLHRQPRGHRRHAGDDPEAEKFGLSYDVVDDLTGKKLGRASSGTFRTADVVGLDTMAHVIKTLQDNLPTTRSTPATPRRRCWPS